MMLLLAAQDAVWDSVWSGASAVGVKLLHAYCIFSVIVVVSVVMTAGGLIVQEFWSRQTNFEQQKKVRAKKE